LWQVGFGLSALFLVYREENLSLYVSPRYIHYRTKSTTAEDVSPPSVIVMGNEGSATTGHTLSGSLGMQYTLGGRFGVFGELGLSHERDELSRSSPDESSSDFEARFTRTGIRSGVGVVFLF